LVTFDAGRVSAVSFDTPYYRTKSGFGVGSGIPLGRVTAFYFDSKFVD
jgi:hypothetical protein